MKSPPIGICPACEEPFSLHPDRCPAAIVKNTGRPGEVSIEPLPYHLRPGQLRGDFRLYSDAELVTMNAAPTRSKKKR